MLELVESKPSRGAAVEAQALVKTYGGRSRTIEAVRGVDLRVEAGEIFGFLGPNALDRKSLHQTV